VGKLASILSGGQYRYVVVNTLVSLVAFGRNLMFMKTLGLADLGQVALMQTIVLLVGFVQLGTLNGAYILFAERNPEQRQRIVDLLSLGVVVLVALVALLAAVGGGQVLSPLVAPETLVIGVFAGVCTLASTWMNNLLIAKGSLGRSNVINMGGVIVSLVVAVLSLPFGLPAALLAILMQPLVVALVALTIDRDLRPASVRPDRATLRVLLALGIMPYLGSLFVLMTYQVERWAIVLVLGQEALGQFYLVMIYMTFFTLIPASLLNVHFPRAMRALQAGQPEVFRSIGRRHLIEILLYGAVALALTAGLLPAAVRSLVPQFTESAHLALLVFPALFIYTMRDSAALVLYSVKTTQPILVSGIIFLVTYAALLGAAVALDVFSLTVVVLMRGVAVGISTAHLFMARHAALREIG